MKAQKNISLETVYETMVKVALQGYPLCSIEDYIDDNFMGYGSAGDEKIYGFDGFKWMVERQRKELDKSAVEIKRHPIYEVTYDDKKTAVIVEEIEINDTNDPELTTFVLRLSTMLNLINDCWKISHFHGSIADANTLEGYAWPIEEIKRKNIELEKQVAEQTADLRSKNRELEIEAALERIRVQATAMQESSDLLDIVVTMHAEFTALGHEAHYFWHMRWLPETYEKAMTSGDGSRIGMVMELPRHIHGDIRLLDEWEKGDGSTVVYAMDVDAAVDYVDKMIRLGDFEQVDPNAPTVEDIRAIGGLTFIMARTTHGEIGFSLPGVVPNPPEDALDTLVRFAGVFDLAYRRFEDLKQSEHRKREAEIELALERVRARTMAMQQSSELSEAGNLLFQQLKQLGIHAETSWLWFINPETDQIEIWTTHENKLAEPVKINPADLHTVQREIEAWKNKVPIVKLSIPENEAIQAINQFFGIEICYDSESEYFHLLQVRHNYGFLGLGTWKEATEEETKVYTRFAKVFEQTYTRFLDLQNAEAQAREAEIELALERVRARTMAMQHSDELIKTSELMFEQIKNLDIELWSCGFSLWYDDDSYFIGYNPGPDGKMGVPLKIPLTENEFFKTIREAKQRGDEFLVFESEGKSLEKTYRYMDTLPVVGETMRGFVEAGYELPKYQVTHCGFFSNGHLMFITREHDPEAVDIFKRFTKVFSQTYTRFLDLQKAEGQAREAKIEAALEKIRSRTMGMQSSDELPEVANLLFLEVQALGIPAWSCGYNILSDDKKTSTCIMSSEGELQVPFELPLTEHYTFVPWHEAILNEEDFAVYELSGDDIIEHYDYMKSLPDLKSTFEQLESAGLELPTSQLNHLVRFTHGFLLFITYEPVLDAHDIFKRFTKVFEQTYTRFLDLQKAEAQAREAQIEAALERVRSRSLAMHKTEELQDVVRVVAEGLKNTGVILDTGGAVICTYFQDSKDVIHWTATEDAAHPSVPYYLPYFKDKLFDEAWASKNRGDNYFAKEFSYDVKNAFFNHAFKHSDYRQLPDEYKKIILESKSHGLAWSWSKNSAIMIPSIQGDLPSEEEKKILIRFAKVFEQSFIRFLDLQKAEEQAREAKIETALEKVRSRTMAMQSSDELQEASFLLDQQVRELGINTWGCAFNIYREDDSIEWFGNERGILPTYNIPREGIFREYYDYGQQGKSIHVQEFSGKECIAHYEYMSTLPVIGDVLRQLKETNGSFPEYQIDHVVYFKYGYLLFITTEPVPEETHDIFKRFAKVFEQTYTRFLDLQRAEEQARLIREERDRLEIALNELNAAKDQLVQQEKLASLGQLTAGIAHEIKNPLNFVNNFSELSVEMIEEVREELKQQTADVKREKSPFEGGAGVPDGTEAGAVTNTSNILEILNDIEANLKKIHEHGSRADSIVKSMLEHSRGGSGKVEPTDLNGLIKEFANLSFHGMRAGKNPINVEINLQLDESIDVVPLVAEDFSRVILNICNNAFDAMREKQNFESRILNPEEYKPKLTIRTQQIDSGISIEIKDNGPGIPEAMKDKILQPFFTTKKGTEGTGLGLSISNDIIKAHGGSIEIESTKGEGSTLSLHLPHLIKQPS